MKILFAGDSITKGALGASFVDIIAKRHPDWQIKNLGKDGATFNRIIERLLDYPSAENDFDYVVLQGGYNDLLLPTFQHKGRWFRFAYTQQIKKGLRPLPADADEAFVILSEAIKKIKALFRGKLILAGIACVGENVQSELNRQRNVLNAVLEKIAATENTGFANTQNKFDGFLQNELPSDYCIESFWAVTVLDRITTLFSNKRKLYLTIDGVHLNQQGAALFAASVLEMIEGQ
jgi:lysophospholipase L1-like esterase